ncbi:MAG: response regulator [Bacteroidetes bacterium]|nr:response regulator [Bacteroidota bacterium]
MAVQDLSQEEKLRRISALLHQVDEDVKAKNLESALEKIRQVYEFDIKNIYARAYEERILVMMMERDREQVMKEAEQKAAEKIDAEVKRRLKDFYRQQEIDAEKRRVATRKEEALEERARQASVSEVKQETNKDLSAIENETLQRIAELEKRLLATMTAPSQLASVEMSTKKLKEEYETKLQAYKKQYEEAEAERKKIQEEAFARMKEEQQRTQEQLIQKFEEERRLIIEREREKEKQHSLDVYKSIMTLLMEMHVSGDIQSPILQSLKISLGVSDTEHMTIEREVQVRAYIEAVRLLYQAPQQTEEDQLHLKNLRGLFHINDDEHLSIVKRITKELGLPDETAVIIAIDDDPAIRMYIDHILKRTYKTVITSVNAESAIAEIQKTPPSLIISDVNLGTGVMSGFTFFEKIRNGEYGESLKNLPLILISSMEDEFFLRSARQLKVKTYITKPFTKEQLETAVKEALA